MLQIISFFEPSSLPVFLPVRISASSCPDGGEAHANSRPIAIGRFIVARSQKEKLRALIETHTRDFKAL
jgi:hypothetical protein